MQTTVIESTLLSLKLTAATLADRERETMNARASLADAERDELAADRSYQDEPSAARREAWDMSTRRREDRARDLHHAEGREVRAREAHDAHVRDELRAELRKAEREADAEVAMAKLADGVVAYALEVDRIGAERIAAARLVVRAQQSAVARARSLAASLGVETSATDVRLDDARVLANVALARQRVAAGRDGPGLEVFLEPIASPWIREQGGMAAPHPRCSEEQFTRAEQILARKATS